MHKYNAALLVAGIVAASLSSPVQAGQRMEERSVAVSAADLNLSTPEGSAMLRQRVKAAAYTLCGQTGSADIVGNADVRRCRKEAIASAKPQVDTLLARANGRNELAYVEVTRP